MILTRLTTGIFSLLLASCGSSGLPMMRPEIDVEIVNKSPHNLENTQARFGESVCPWGTLVKSSTAIYLFYPGPITPDAELSWYEPTGRRVEMIDLRKIYPRGKSGRLTFTIHDSRAEATFREKATPR
jgi:hypothetical protein